MQYVKDAIKVVVGTAITLVLVAGLIVVIDYGAADMHKRIDTKLCHQLGHLPSGKGHCERAGMAWPQPS